MRQGKTRQNKKITIQMVLQSHNTVICLNTRHQTWDINKKNSYITFMGFSLCHNYVLVDGPTVKMWLNIVGVYLFLTDLVDNDWLSGIIIDCNKQTSTKWLDVKFRGVSFSACFKRCMILLNLFAKYSAFSGKTAYRWPVPYSYLFCNLLHLL